MNSFEQPIYLGCGVIPPSIRFSIWLEKRIKLATHTSSTEPTTTAKPHSLLMPSQTIRGYDTSGCTIIGFTRIHQATLKLHCAKFIAIIQTILAVVKVVN